MGKRNPSLILIRRYLLTLTKQFWRNSIDKRVLIFNQQKRDSGALIAALANSLKGMLGTNSSIFDEAIFCTNVTSKDAGKAG